MPPFFRATSLAVINNNKHEKKKYLQMLWGYTVLQWMPVSSKISHAHCKICGEKRQCRSKDGFQTFFFPHFVCSSINIKCKLVEGFKSMLNTKFIRKISFNLPSYLITIYGNHASYAAMIIMIVHRAMNYDMTS